MFKTCLKTVEYFIHSSFKFFQGMCNDCMFNTTGKHCHECKSGFKGDALKRTCLPFTKETLVDITINSNYNFEYSCLQ